MPALNNARNPILYIIACTPYNSVIKDEEAIPSRACGIGAGAAEKIRRTVTETWSAVDCPQGDPGSWPLHGSGFLLLRRSTPMLSDNISRAADGSLRFAGQSVPALAEN